MEVVFDRSRLLGFDHEVQQRTTLPSAKVGPKPGANGGLAAAKVSPKPLATIAMPGPKVSVKPPRDSLPAAKIGFKPDLHGSLVIGDDLDNE